ncbi:polysaccharide deacetylase family protein [Rudaea sp.]|uniref:polysaccharide deacetylase family protein n=1 Tax=Rudaea sp. TaxID=2136325 RepID=UPI00321FFF5E
MTPGLCVAVHDVAPATWPQCARLLELVDALGAPPLTLLVVPDWHAQGRIDAAPEFRRAIDARIERGDEVALHGYFHRDAAPAPRSPGAWLRRRVLTASEGEFAAVDAHTAAARLHAGLDLLRRQGWTVDGFVPPAWLANAATRRALRHTDLRWTSTHTALIALDGGDERRIAAPCLTASPRSAWRRAASRAFLRAGLHLGARAPLVRIGLHPADAGHADLLACWRDVLGALLAVRRATTKSQAVAAAVGEGKYRDAVGHGDAVR